MEDLRPPSDALARRAAQGLRRVRLQPETGESTNGRLGLHSTLVFGHPNVGASKPGIPWFRRIRW